MDGHGHGHFYNNQRAPYPTLRWISEPCTMGHGGDCESEGHYECPLCGEEIRPGERLAQPMWVDGPDTYKLTVTHEDGQRFTYQFGEDQWVELRSAWLSATQAVLGGHVTDIRSMA